MKSFELLRSLAEKQCNKVASKQENIYVLLWEEDVLIIDLGLRGEKKRTFVQVRSALFRRKRLAAIQVNSFKAR